MLKLGKNILIWSAAIFIRFPISLFLLTVAELGVEAKKLFYKFDLFMPDPEAPKWLISYNKKKCEKLYYANLERNKKILLSRCQKEVD